MKAKLEVNKSFDDSGIFTKVWKQGDFEEFFRDEGEYLDKLSELAGKHGTSGELFTVTYTVTVSK